MFQKMFLLTSFIVVLSVASVGSAGLEGWWPLDGNANDVSGKDRHGTIFGDPIFEEGVVGQAIAFDGVDDYVNIDGYKGINAIDGVQQPFSIANWFKITATSGDHEMVTWGTNAGTQRLTWRVHEGRLRTEHGSGNLRGNTYVNDGEWHHGALVVNEGAALRVPQTLLFADGVEDTIFSGSDSRFNLTANADVSIGRRADNNSRYWPGSIDEVMIFSRTLSAEQVQQAMDGIVPQWPKADKPVPADGAVDVDPGTLEWRAGTTAVSHKVYLSADPTIDEADLIAETDMTIVAVVLEPGITYSWRVDEVEADGKVVEGDVWTFSTMPLEAHFPVPADGATNVTTPVTLQWTPGKVVVMHQLYIGTDEAAIAARDMTTFKGMLMQASYDTGPLDLFSTYYWAVDEFTPTGTVAGPVWSFSTPKYVVINDPEATLNYDNTAEPYVSELAFDTPMDITAGGIVSDLTLNFKGQPSNLSIDEATGTYTVSGAGADVWGSSDQFHYVYKELTGDATITARVVSNGTGSNTWAKGGVMIRETTAGNSKHMIMGMTGSDGGGICFQGRPITGDRSNSFHGDITASPPYWVRLVREGNNITAYCSADGVDWQLFTDTSPDGAQSNPQPVEMTDPVLIGLFVTSHAAGEVRTYTFDNVSIEGNVSADFVSEDIDSVSGNSAEPVYVAIEDMLGATATVVHPNPAATQIPAYRSWTIPLSEFGGIDPTLAAKLYVGVGDGSPGGAGVLNVAEIRIVEPDPSAGIESWQAAAATDSPGYIATNVPLGVYDIGTYGGEQTYEFVVKSNPDEQAVSMALIGRFSQDGGNRAALKFDQWNNTGEYGATLFGVVDLYFGVPNNPGEDVHLVFVSSEAAGTCSLYVNGVYQASVDRAISLSGLVGIGGANRDLEGTGWVDPFDGVIYGVAIYDAALSDDEIAAHSSAFFVPVVDVTMPGDTVLGIPRGLPCGGNASENYSPCGELPPLVIDDNVNTKYLNFGGNFDPGEEPSGFLVTPLNGASIVTGMTFTTANDAAPRDPVAFELSGSNGTIEGPYEVIAAGDIVDFAQEAEWPRYTKNATPITFANSTAYAHYRVLFPAIRDAASANSMQIAEVELLGHICSPCPP